jgi:bacteriorhodopsin
MVPFSFYITYVLLLTTGTITLIEALRTKVKMVQHIMNLETCISVVAGYFYSVLHEKLKKMKEINWKEITHLRYIDWTITTPIMLLVLSLVLSFNSKTTIQLHWFAVTIFFNYVMLYAGYVGETGQLEKMTASVIGFIALFLMYGLVCINYLLPKQNRDNTVLFSLFVVIWSMYGVAYHFEEEQKNVAYNYLDLISKCLVGIGLWMYYTKIIRTA